MQPTTHSPAGRKEWLGFAVLALPTLLVSMDMTILYLATPTLSAVLQPSGAELLMDLRHIRLSDCGRAHSDGRHRRSHRQASATTDRLCLLWTLR